MIGRRGNEKTLVIMQDMISQASGMLVEVDAAQLKHTIVMAQGDAFSALLDSVTKNTDVDVGEFFRTNDNARALAVMCKNPAARKVAMQQVDDLVSKRGNEKVLVALKKILENSAQNSQ